MICPRCKAKIGIVKHVVVVHSGSINCVKCLICGYWAETEG